MMCRALDPCWDRFSYLVPRLSILGSGSPKSRDVVCFERPWLESSLQKRERFSFYHRQGIKRRLVKVMGVNAKMPGFLVVALHRMLACGSKDRVGDRGKIWRLLQSVIRTREIYCHLQEPKEHADMAAGLLILHDDGNVLSLALAEASIIMIG